MYCGGVNDISIDDVARWLCRSSIRDFMSHSGETNSGRYHPLVAYLLKQ